MAPPEDAYQRSLPEAFVWSKMGTEGGEGLETILRRKEYERVLGNGLFVWGIGNALGDAVHALAAFAPSPIAVFSPMATKPRHQDVAPEEVVIWRAYEGSAGEAIPLPPHTVVTSRGHREGLSKARHYALFCHSAEPIATGTGKFRDVIPTHHRNFASGRSIGASQVTAVVRRAAGEIGGAGRSYPVAFSATLVGPRYVRLLCPRLIRREELAAVAKGLGALNEWKAVATALRSGAS